ncbi:PB1-F2 protein, partial [Influenza A virus]
WTMSTEHINIQKRGGGQQTRKPEHPNSTQLTDHYLRTTSQVGMHKRIACWKQWLSLRNPTQGYLKTLVLKRWKPFSKQEWTN